MIVHWTTTLSYKKKEEMVKFCEDNDLNYEWQKAPKSHYVILDILETAGTADKISDFVGEEVKTTHRDNKVKALQRLKNTAYGIIKKEYHDMPAEPMERFTTLIEEIESDFHIKLERADALYTISDVLYNHENMLQGRNIPIRHLIDKISVELTYIEWGEDEKRIKASYDIAIQAVDMWKPEGRKNANNDTSPGEVADLLEKLYKKETGIEHSFEHEGLHKALKEYGVNSYWWSRVQSISIKQASIDKLRKLVA